MAFWYGRRYGSALACGIAPEGFANMSIRTIFLARALGLYCLVLAAAIFLRRDTFVTTVNALITDAPLVLVVGVFTLFIGVAMVLLHNFWSGGVLPVIITMVGWGTLIKGVLLLALPPASLVALYTVPSHYVTILCCLSLALGVYLVIEGFGRRSPR
jgi:hypothetical protein